MYILQLFLGGEWGYFKFSSVIYQYVANELVMKAKNCYNKKKFFLIAKTFKRVCHIDWYCIINY